MVAERTIIGVAQYERNHHGISAAKKKRAPGRGALFLR
jgi:hypothetical protein